MMSESVRPTGHNVPRHVRFARAVFTVLLLAGAVTGHAQDWEYRARPGDNLWNLSKQYLERGIAYVGKLQDHNSIENPYRIPPGSTIRMPVRWLKVQPVPASVVQLTGSAERIADGAAAGLPLSVGATLVTGDRVVTAPDSNVLIQFADGSRLLVQAQTTVRMDTMSAYEGTGMVDTRVRLQGGRTESAAEPAVGPGSRYQIMTPPAVAAVRGTDFRMAFEAGRDVARSEVTEGTVGVGGKGVTRAVRAGFGVVAEAGKAPEKPRALLAPPDLSSVPGLQERPLLSFEWTALANAKAYRAQLYGGAGFERLMLDKRVKGPAVQWNAPPDGEYRLRVRGIDDRDLEGLNADRTFILDARPEPPSLLEPPDGGTLVEGEKAAFWWSEPEGAVSFRFQLASDAEFRKLLLDESEHTGARLTVPEPLPPGTYFWRMATTAAPEGKGPLGDPASFRVLAVPEVPVAEAPGIDEETVRFSWQQAADTERYEFQLARDPEFADIMVEESLTETSFSAPRPASGVYYFRARGISPEGIAGPYSTVNRVEVPSEASWMLLLFLIPLVFVL